MFLYKKIPAIGSLSYSRDFLIISLVVIELDTEDWHVLNVEAHSQAVRNLPLGKYIFGYLAVIEKQFFSSNISVPLLVFKTKVSCSLREERYIL